MNRRRFLVLIVFLFVRLVGAAHAQNLSDLPYDTSAKEFESLYRLVDHRLESKLRQELGKNRTWARMIRDRTLAVGIVDISDPENVRFARINGRVMMYAASLPKLAVLLAGMQSLEDGTLEETPGVLSDMRQMISRSDNLAATRMIDRIGMDKINAVMADPRYELYDPERGGGLWVGKRYAAEGKRLGDPIKGLSHAATVTQICRFYYLLSMGKLVSQDRSAQMLDILSEPELRHKFVRVLMKRIPHALLFRKSGTWRQWHSDSVLVWGPVWRRYIAAALVEDANGEKTLRRVIGVIDDLLEQEHALRTMPEHQRLNPKSTDRG